MSARHIDDNQNSPEDLSICESSPDEFEFGYEHDDEEYYLENDEVEDSESFADIEKVQKPFLNSISNTIDFSKKCGSNEESQKRSVVTKEIACSSSVFLNDETSTGDLIEPCVKAISLSADASLPRQKGRLPKLGFVREVFRRKDYEVDYTILSVEEITESLNQEIDQISSIIAIPNQFVILLLRHFRWDKQTVLERYMEDSDAAIRAARVPLPSDDLLAELMAGVRENAFLNPAKDDFSCSICCTEQSDMPDGEVLETFGLPCGHIFCRKCYSHYVTGKIVNEGESARLTCMDQCNLFIDEMSIKLLCSEDVYERYKKLFLRSYLDDNKTVRWCPAPNCDLAIECAVPDSALTRIVPTVLCECGNSFCFGCGLESHGPCICQLALWWTKKGSDDSETANWISANTKDCTKCRSTIEKNGGCNHMTCRKCKHEWCWICLGDWADHGQSWYKCNRFIDGGTKIGDEIESKQRARRLLERYIHYFTRYDIHMRSAQQTQDLYAKSERSMEELQRASDLSWIEVQFLKHAVDVSVSCRKTLQWTYAMAFYLDQNSNYTTMFEEIQCDLELAVENLTKLIEMPVCKLSINEHKQNVVNKTEYVKRRQEIVLIDTSRGFREGRWKWIQSEAFI